MNPSEPNQGKTPPIKFPAPVRRIRIRVRGGEWSILDQVEIPQMTLRRSAELPSAGAGRGVAGFWVEAVDTNRRTIYRALAPNPFERSVEVFDAGGQPHRVDASGEQALFDVLIPDLPEIAALVFYSDVTPEGRRRPRAEVVQQLPLRRPGKRGGQHGRK